MKLRELMDGLRALEPDHEKTAGILKIYFVEEEEGRMRRFILIEPAPRPDWQTD